MLSCQQATFLRRRVPTEEVRERFYHLGALRPHPLFYQISQQREKHSAMHSAGVGRDCGDLAWQCVRTRK